VTKAVKKVAGKIPVFIKLSPQALSIGEIAKACADGGADGYTVINTVGPGMAIDLKSRMPILSNRVGGMSGPAIKPIAIRCVADVYSATGGKLPIIGTGGVFTRRRCHRDAARGCVARGHRYGGVETGRSMCSGRCARR
jgi:dihydroorotate dehydrogenase (NAD+) catalytic subunit